jgi:hypothetical protein
MNIIIVVVTVLVVRHMDPVVVAVQAVVDKVALVPKVVTVAPEEQ